MISKIVFGPEQKSFWQNIYDANPLQVPFLTYNWHEAWHETIGKNWKPHILNINNDVIAPFAKKDYEIIFSGGIDVADYLDIIGDDEAKKKAWPEIIAFLKQEGITSLHLNNIPENSPTLEVFPHEKEDTTPMMSLPPTLDKKARHEMERKIRKFERRHSNIEIHDERNIDLLLTLMKLDQRKNKFLTPLMELFFRKIVEQFQKHIIQTILTINNKPVATLVAFRVGDMLMSYNSGFDEEHFSGAGFYLKAMHIKRAVDNGIKVYNFLQGGERYKYDLGGKDFFVYKIDVAL